MDRLKTLSKYVIWVVAFFIFSNFLIYVGLNSSYYDLKRNDTLDSIEIYQAQATKVNGRIRGLIKNNSGENLKGKFVEIEFYSRRNNYLGRNYVEIDELEENETQAFEMYFKLQNVSYYKVSIVNEKKDLGKLEILNTDLSRKDVKLLAFFTMLMLK